ncbi:MAG TPA: ABC transporter ATP-binding protein [Nocardioides sp.]|uniref:ABC transporter ATP-binding protein n=1 Tax=Nocardioides sp. TaxID=35761 RepID=UPI002C176500|nr:ABC transporter ATP-binding protein [Nocardioides sp.]HQR27448.1 ABC transporter ATP-binding protein [Nocardioides sp.]
MGAAVEVEGLAKRYGGTVAVDGMSFRVEEGEIVGLLGHNGSGKTTTVECVQGLRRPDAGVIRVLGFDAVTQRREVRRLIGSQLQDSALPDRLRVGEALELFSTLSRRSRPWTALMEDWGLSALRRTAFGDLSGGQRQRLFVALALVADPRVVILDEMTTGLDPVARRVAWDLVAQVRDRGATVLLVTHFMDEAERLCDRLLVVRRGRLVADGTPVGLVRAHLPAQRVRFSMPPGTDTAFLRGVPGVRTVERVGASTVVVTGNGPLLARVGHALVDAGHEPEDLEPDTPTLEDAFLALTAEDPPDPPRGRVAR